MSIRKIRTPKTQKSIEITGQFKSIFLTVSIAVLAIANIFFIVSMVLQILNATGGEVVQQPKLQEVIPEAAPEREPARVENKKILITVEVLNGCGVDGIASTLREYLIARNFDVVDFKNYENFNISETLVIDRVRLDKRNAEKVADAIGIGGKQVIAQTSPQRKLDVTVVIGKDYAKLRAYK